MTASEVTGQGFVRNGAYDTFATGTGDVAGATPLWVAAYGMNPGPGSASFRNRRLLPTSTGGVLESLLAAGARPDLTPNDRTTPLMAAAGCGRAAHLTNVPRAPRVASAEEAVDILIAAGLDVNATNEGDFTALHCAAFSGLNEVVRQLLSHGADIDARDWRGRTAFRLAQARSSRSTTRSGPRSRPCSPSSGPIPASASRAPSTNGCADSWRPARSLRK